MIFPSRLRSLTVALAVLSVGESIEAQIKASLGMSKKEYIAHEPVIATVTLTNNAGRDLLIHTDGRTTLNWLRHRFFARCLIRYGQIYSIISSC